MTAHDRFMMLSDAHGRGWFFKCRSSQPLLPTHRTFARWRPIWPDPSEPQEPGATWICLDD